MPFNARVFLSTRLRYNIEINAACQNWHLRQLYGIFLFDFVQCLEELIGLQIFRPLDVIVSGYGLQVTKSIIINVTCTHDSYCCYHSFASLILDISFRYK